jgi:hypothetical protein
MESRRSGAGDLADGLVEAGKDWLALMRQRIEQGEARLRDLKQDGATGRRARDFERAHEQLVQTMRALSEGDGEARRAVGRAAAEYDAALAALDGEAHDD